MRKTGCSSMEKLMIQSACVACLGFMLSCAMLFVGAVLVEYQVLPDNMVLPLSWGSVAFSMLCTAFFAAGDGEGRIVAGLCAGFVYFLLALICGILLGGELDCTKVAIMGSLILADAIAGAMLSGLIRG